MSENVAVTSSESAHASGTRLGFWLYLMSDCLLFGSLFATFMVLRNATAGGQSGKDLFDLQFVFVETIVLLTSSFACGIAVLSAHQRNKKSTLNWLVITGLLGLIFLGLEIHEFTALASEGHSWTKSAFLSSYFGLVGTHGIHIAVGLIWLAALVVFINKNGMGAKVVQRLGLFSLFWHFLDIVWICIFTIVYLAGVI